MGLLTRTMEYYPYVAHPITVYYEWNHQTVDRRDLWNRIGGFLGTGIIALLPTVAYILVTGVDPIQATKGNHWQMDALVVVGIFLGAASPGISGDASSGGGSFPTQCRRLLP